MRNALILQGDVRTRLRELPDESIHCVVTSPPYWGLRDYKLEPQIWDGDPEHTHVFNLPAATKRAKQPDRSNDAHDANDRGIFGDGIARGTQPSRAARGGPAIKLGDFCECGAWLGSLGLEPSPDLWVDHLVEIFRDVRRVLRHDGTLWLNCGDAFANDYKWGGATGGKHPRAIHGDQIGRAKRHTGLKPKDLIGMPWMLAFALRADGWWLRSDIIWHKPAPMPESVGDRPTRAHEYLFLLTKSEKYFYDAEAIKEPASPGTHARLSQASLQSQNGGGKQEAYLLDNDIGKKSADRTPSQILKAMAKKNGINPKAKKRPSGWQEGSGAHDTLDHAGEKDRGRNAQGLKDSTKFGRGKSWREHEEERLTDGKTFLNDGGDYYSKQNASFAEATAGNVVLTRNKRSVWTIASEPLKDAHYAAYPTELVRPCVMAGTSEYGCCPNCLAPWIRIVEPSEAYAEQLGKDWAEYDQDNFEGRGKLVRNNNHPVKRGTSMCAEYHTIGFRPGCECGGAKCASCEWTGWRFELMELADCENPVCPSCHGGPIVERTYDPIPCTVLDPFNGSGTTGIVALGLGCDYIGLELKPEYCELARSRITSAANLLNKVEIRYTIPRQQDVGEVIK